MNVPRWAGVWLLCLLTVSGSRPAWAAAQAPPASQPPPPSNDPQPAAADDGNSADSAALYRVFLKDGTSLVSYGEVARVGESVVFSMPTTSSAVGPQLQLINIPAERVDWERTQNYAESVRSRRYLATRAAADYALLTNVIAQALNDVTLTDDPVRRVAIVEAARKTLADWPAAHYNYRRDEIQQMLASLDEAIAGMRAATGADTFDLALVAPAVAPPADEPILPPPSAQEVIEQTLRAAGLTTSPAERVSLLSVAVRAIDAEADNLPADWASATRAQVQAQIARELDLDRRYKALGQRMVRLAGARAALADVRGVERVLAAIKANDQQLGSSRPDTVASIVADVEEQLDLARRLRLERDRWALRAPDLRAYRAAMAASLERLRQLTPLLEDIKSLAGSGPDALATILRSTAQMSKDMTAVKPPSELADIHNLFVSAVQLARNAATIRREAAIGGNIARAWDASSAAAGALMLAARARTDLVVALRPPQTPR